MSETADPCWPHPLRGVALDLDGLMFDTEPLYYETGCRILARRGREFTDALRRQMMGRPAPAAMQLMIDQERLRDRLEDLMAEADHVFRELIADDLRMLPGLERLLGTLEARRLPFGVATSSRRAVAEEILQRSGILPRLRFLIAGDEVEHGKPHPEIYLRAAERIGIAPRELLVLEDSGNGCAAGVAAGACVVVVPGDHSRHHEFPGACAALDRLDAPALWRLFEEGIKGDAGEAQGEGRD